MGFIEVNVDDVRIALKEMGIDVQTVAGRRAVVACALMQAYKA